MSRPHTETRERATARALGALAARRMRGSSLESLLSRLVTATSVADLGDQSRLLFEVKAGLIDVEELLRRPDSSAGGPPNGEGAELPPDDEADEELEEEPEDE